MGKLTPREKVPISYWEFALEDTPGGRKKEIPAEARKVSHRKGEQWSHICICGYSIWNGGMVTLHNWEKV